jgi:hypothetical protein
MPPQPEDLPGVEGEGVSQQKRIKAVEEAFGDLLAHRAKRMKAGENEQASSAVLTALFHKHNLKHYFYDDVKYMLQGKEKIIKAPKDVDVDGE